MNDLIPHLRDLCFSQCGFQVPPGFAQAYVRQHRSDWVLAQDHWERVVRLALKSSDVDERPPGKAGKRAMRQAVTVASECLHKPLLRERCPFCRRVR